MVSKTEAGSTELYIYLEVGNTDMNYYYTYGLFSQVSERPRASLRKVKLPDSMEGAWSQGRRWAFFATRQRVIAFDNASALSSGK